MTTPPEHSNVLGGTIYFLKKIAIYTGYFLFPTTNYLLLLLLYTEYPHSVYLLYLQKVNFIPIYLPYVVDCRHYFNYIVDTRTRYFLHARRVHSYLVDNSYHCRTGTID